MITNSDYFYRIIEDLEELEEVSHLTLLEKLKIFEIIELRIANDLYIKANVISSNDAYPSALEKIAMNLKN